MDFCGDVFRQLAPILGFSVRMALEGTSASVGAPPRWLRRASDVRVVGFSGRRGNTILHLEAPVLGEAADEVYSQNTLWATKPDGNQTAVNVFATVLNEVRSANQESTLFDRQLLNRLRHLHGLFSHQLIAVGIPKDLGDQSFSATLDETIVANATQLSDRTPPPAQVRLVGKLDMIRHSTRSFGLITEDDNEVRGILETQEQMDLIRNHLGSKVLVLGKAIYRPSGTLLRIDAENVEAGEGQSPLFTRVPPPRVRKPAIIRAKVTDQSRNGIPAFFGTWPGDETDEDLLAMLEEVRH